MTTEAKVSPNQSVMNKISEVQKLFTEFGKIVGPEPEYIEHCTGLSKAILDISEKMKTETFDEISAALTINMFDMYLKPMKALIVKANRLDDSDSEDSDSEDCDDLSIFDRYNLETNGDVVLSKPMQEYNQAVTVCNSAKRICDMTKKSAKSKDPAIQSAIMTAKTNYATAKQIKREKYRVMLEAQNTNMKTLLDKLSMKN